MSPKRSRERLSTGVDGLDRMLGGGLLRGDATLVAGSPGTGKTTLGLHYVASGVHAGEPGVFVTFEYLPQQIYRDAARKGWPLEQWEDEGLLRLVCTSPDVLLASDGSGGSILDEMVEDVGASRLVIDSMTHFEFEETFLDGELRPRLSGLMNRLRMLNVTPLVTHEIPQIVGQNVKVSDYGLEFLVDNVLLLRYVELEGELQKALNVLKFRGGDHDRRYRSIRLTDRGMRVEADLSDVENITGGTAHRRFKDRAKDLL